MSHLLDIVYIIDFLGAIGFIAASIYGYKNFKKTESISPYWLIFTIAAILGSAWSFSVGLEWLDIYSKLLDEIQQIILAGSTVAFVITAILSYKEFLKPVR